MADLLERHGGHAQAAGFTIRNENVPEFIDRMTEMATDWLQGQDLRPVLEVDAEVPLHQIDWALQENLSQLEPTGYDNPAPLFVSRGVEVISFRAVGQDGSHLQLVLHDGRNGNGGNDRNGHRSATFPAIAFRQAAWAGRMPDRIDVAYSVGINQWNGSSTLQLMVEDIRPQFPSETEDPV